MTNHESDEKQEALMEAARERSAVPPLRDILKREHNEARPRDEALEKWGPMIEEGIWRELEREQRKIQPPSTLKTPTFDPHPKKDSPDMDMDR
jgi:hypothetical protein